MIDRRFARIMRDRSQELVLAGVVEKIITNTQAKALYVTILGAISILN